MVVVAAALVELPPELRVESAVVGLVVDVVPWSLMRRRMKKPSSTATSVTTMAIADPAGALPLVVRAPRP